MGFYDRMIKGLFVNCPRLVVLAINTIFNQNYDINTDVIYLDKEQNSVSTTYMDALVQICGNRYHFEFQMKEDEMALRMFEYATKETVQLLKKESKEKYCIDAIMPRQVVVFLTGANKEDKIKTRLQLPDGNVVEYEIDCISVARPAEELVDEGLTIFTPFQSARLGEVIDGIKYLPEGNQTQAAKEVATSIVVARKNVEALLSDIQNRGIISLREQGELMSSVDDIQKYLVKKNKEVSEEVTSMGDEDYIPYSHIVKMEARAEGLAEGRAEGREEGLALGRAEMQSENEALREEISDLRAEIEALKAAMASV